MVRWEIFCFFACRSCFSSVLLILGNPMARCSTGGILVLLFGTRGTLNAGSRGPAPHDVSRHMSFRNHRLDLLAHPPRSRPSSPPKTSPTVSRNARDTLRLLPNPSVASLLAARRMGHFPNRKAPHQRAPPRQGPETHRFCHGWQPAVRAQQPYRDHRGTQHGVRNPRKSLPLPPPSTPSTPRTPRTPRTPHTRLTYCRF